MFNRKKILFLLACMTGAAVFLCGCGNDKHKTEGNTVSTNPVAGTTNTSEAAGETADTGIKVSAQLEIVTTLFPQYDFARYIVGDYGSVTMILPPGTESHSYEPTPEDMVTISDADMFIYTGVEMEPWAQTLADTVDMTKVSVVDVSEGVSTIGEEAAHDHEAEGFVAADEEEEGHEHSYDPHIWLDMANAQQMVQTVADAVSTQDPAHEAEYQQRAADYIAQLQTLDGQFKEIVAASDHPTLVFGGRFSYGYFVNAYNVDYVSVYDGCDAEAEPSMQQMAAVIDFVKGNDIPVILYEDLSTPNIAQSIADSTGAKILLFYTGHNVTKDQMADGTTFIDLMTQNAQTLRQAIN